MDKVQTQSKKTEALRSQGLCVETDCGDIEVTSYDDIAGNGIEIYLDGVLVCRIECSREQESLPTSTWIPHDRVNQDVNIYDAITEYLTDEYGYCVEYFHFRANEDGIDVFDIEWDIEYQDPEAKLLVYQSNANSDEPQNVIILN